MPVEGQGQRRHAECQQHKAPQIKTPGLQGVIGHQPQGGYRADNPDRQINQKNPVPGGVFHQHAAQRRTEQRPDLAWQSNERHRRHVLLARDDFHHRQPSDRHHHCPADALQHARHHQFVERAGERAEQRTERKENDGGTKNIPHAHFICQPAAGGQHHRHRQHIADDHHVHMQRAFPEAFRH